MKAIAPLALIFMISAPALANDWLPAERGDVWAEITSANPPMQGHGHGETRQVEVDAQLGGWRHFTDFVGLGPLWVHTTIRNRVYVFNGITYELLFDLDDPAGLASRRTVNLMRPRMRLQSGIYARNIPLTTRTTTFPDCVVAEITIETASDTEHRFIWFARGEGVVRWSNALPAWVYLVREDHDLERVSAAGPDRIDVPTAHHAIRRGNHALVATDTGVSVIDLADGTTSRTLSFPEPVYKLTLRGDSLLAEASGQTFSLNLERPGTAWPLAATGLVPLPDSFARLVPSGGLGMAIRIAPSWDLNQATHEVTPSVFSLWSLKGHDLIDDVLYVPGTYPGGLMALDVQTGTEVFAFNVNDWLYDVKVFGRNAIVTSTAGLAVIDLDTQAFTPLAPGSFVPGNHLFKASDGAYAVVSRPTGAGFQNEYDIVKVSAAGTQTLTAPLNLGTGQPPRIVDVQGDRALLLVAGEGLRWADLR